MTTEATNLSAVASAVCLVAGRVRFLDPAGQASGAPLQGQVVLYLGENPQRFARSFAALGQAYARLDNDDGMGAQ
jgi:hypothetical protein